MNLKSVVLYCVRLWYRFIGDTGVIFLSDGWPIKVRKLDLYELDEVPYDDPGQFLYPYKTSSGRVIEKIYDISQWAEAPKAPTIPEHECEEGSFEADLWHVYNTYQAALAHRIKQVDAGDKYTKDVGKYIINNCINERDRGRVKTSDDYDKIYAVALNSEVSMEDIESALDSTFPGFIRRSTDIEKAFQGINQKLWKREYSPIMERGNQKSMDIE